jgi:hypothetical protein
MKNYLKTLVLLKIVVLSAVLAAAGQDYSGDDSGITKPITDYEIKNATSETRAAAAALTVNDNGDATDIAPGNGVCETAAGNGVCTLRAAVAEANALAGDDTINFAAGITSISVSGQIAISSNIAINGTGAGVLTVQNIAAASTTSRVFDITAGSTVSISGMTVSGGGVTTGDGGGIRSSGILIVSGCIIMNNTNTGTSNNGGGIRGNAGSTLTINNTVINNNRSANSGGLSFAGSALTVTNSVIRDNTATNGNGGGANIAATVSVTITNTTISGNAALNSSGGFFTTRGNFSNVTVSGNTANGSGTNGGGGARIQAGANTASFTSCTFTNNNAPNAAAGARSGIWHETGTVTLSNTIVAANITQDYQRDGTAVLSSGGFNLIGENTSVTTEFPAGTPNGTNYVGTDAAPLNPGLAPLADNGGGTLTHAFTAGSIAVDKGNSFMLNTDQRGLTRPVDLLGVTNTAGGDGADIGAFEAQIVSVSGRVFDSAGNPLKGAIVSYTDSTAMLRAVKTNTFGYFKFTTVESAQTYTFSATAKGYSFAPQMIYVGDNLSGVIFTGTE